MLSIQMKGARLAYVVRPINGTVTRYITTFERGRGLVKKKVTQPGGFMVYFPRGHCIRLSQQALKHYGLHKPAPMADLGDITDPTSPAGRLLAAQDDQARAAAFTDFEKQVIRLATRKTGTHVLTRAVADETDAA